MNSALPRIAILLATRNGEAFLREQLDSFAAQTLRPALVLVGDDASTDGTHEILRDFARANPDIPLEIRNGPRRGSAQNFLSLLRAVPEQIDMVAISDQDDVWLPERLARGAAALGTKTAPALHASRTLVCDERLQNRVPSRGNNKPLGFRHAIVQNFAGGNTFQLNRAALELVRDASTEPRKVVVHDWWIYQIISGAGGMVTFDDVPQVLYRQHGRNLIGANNGLRAKRHRFRLMLSGRFRRWNTINIIALKASAHRLTPEARSLLADFERRRRAGLFGRLHMLGSTGIYRQDLAGNVSLWIAALLGKL